MPRNVEHCVHSNDQSLTQYTTLGGEDLLLYIDRENPNSMLTLYIWYFMHHECFSSSSFPFLICL